MKKFDYYIFIDYSEDLIGYNIIAEDKIEEILPRISKIHHYKERRHKKQYIASIRKLMIKNNIESFLLEYKIENIRANALIFVRVLEFVKKYDNCFIFISIDNNQYKAFIKLFNLFSHKENVFIVRESDLKKNSLEYRLSLIIDNMINIKRIKESKKTHQTY